MIKLPVSLTTITPFSKYLAMVVFISFPILAFFAGMNYQKMIDQMKYQQTDLTTLKPTPTPNPIANWKTYSDTKNGFSFKYPNKGIIVEESSNFVNIMFEPGNAFNPGSGISFVVEVIDNPENLNLEESHEDYDNVPCDPKEWKCENVIINGLHALKAYGVPSAGKGYDAYYLQNGKSIYRLSWRSSYKEEQLGDQILATFRFLP